MKFKPGEYYGDEAAEILEAVLKTNIEAMNLTTKTNF
mgnify:CR=1 FL=1